MVNLHAVSVVNPDLHVGRVGRVYAGENAACLYNVYISVGHSYFSCPHYCVLFAIVLILSTQVSLFTNKV